MTLHQVLSKQKISCDILTFCTPQDSKTSESDLRKIIISHKAIRLGSRWLRRLSISLWIGDRIQKKAKNSFFTPKNAKISQRIYASLACNGLMQLFQVYTPTTA